MGALGAPELIIILVAFAAPFAVLYFVADAWAQSKAHVLWGLLGWLGVIIGLIVMGFNRNNRSAG